MIEEYKAPGHSNWWKGEVSELPTYPGLRNPFEETGKDGKMNTVKRTERGWPGHYCLAHRCGFRRNTLLEKGNIRIIVSTIGARYEDRIVMKIAPGRYYETMVFEAQKVGIYWDVENFTEIRFDAPWSIKKVNINSDNEANDMHEAVVTEMIEQLEKGIESQLLGNS